MEEDLDDRIKSERRLVCFRQRDVPMLAGWEDGGINSRPLVLI